MKNKFRFVKRMLSVFLCLAILLAYLPIVFLTTSAADNANSTSIADPKTLSEWEHWFSADSSRYAGGVFLDKSVYTATEAKADNYFHDVKDSLSFGKDNFGNENFMIALSALGSNSEVLGYSHTPTDTVLVLDASTSMGTGSATSSSIDDMVAGANEAIKRLLALNNYNRVGVVIYNGTSSLLLPLDRYTSANANGDILTYVRRNNQNRISIASDIKDGGGNAVAANYIAQAQGTYTQGGIYAATQEFLKADTVIEDGKIQGGTKRLPIMVLMSDGEPSYRTKTGSNTTINKYSTATNDNCDRTNFREDDVTAFSTMLTAAWAEAEISAHYGQDTRFYTLGYALSASHQYAQNVLDPMNPNNRLAARFSGYAQQYLAMQQNTTAAIRNENNQVAFRVTRASSTNKVKSLDYVDRYWQASQASQLSGAFDAIVDEIIIQSRYYSTLVSNNNYAQDGFISFTDEIGSYMEVKNIKGLYVGDGKLVSGGMFAEFATTGEVKDYDGTDYSKEKLQGFENEILGAASERFGISLSEASLLINTAREKGFISYTSPSEFSNYIAWYADDDNKYLAPYTNTASHAHNGAKYIVRSYFYMGDVMQNHVETSMLYALVRVREDIETGRQIVDMNVPAALLPLVTYTITVDGDVLNDQNVIGITCQQKKPISLLFEVGLDSDITPINITEKVKEDFYKDQDGVYTFYTNRWRTDTGTSFAISPNPDPHVFNHGIMNTTVTQFIPSLENERFYYTENMQLLDSNHNVYNGPKPTGGEYYVTYKWVEGNANAATLKTAYNPVSSEIFKDADNIIQIDGKPGWFIKKGTAQFYFGEDVHGEQAHSHKTDNKTKTLGFSDYPQVVYHDDESHAGYHMLNYLGNNGLIKVTPSQGIKLTKTVSQKVSGAPDSFRFEISLTGTNLAGSYPVYIESADGTTKTITATVEAGKISVTLADGDVAYIYGLPVGTEYKVTEDYSKYYTASSSNANGTVASHTFSNVDFVNSPKGYGSLLVEKDVTYPFNTISNELLNIQFDISVRFEGNAEDLAQIKVPENSGLNPVIENGAYTYSFKLKDGYDILFTNIPTAIAYTVTENNIPSGFTLETTDLSGRISENTQSEVLLVNDYNPAAVSPEITVSGEKILDNSNDPSRVWDSSIDKYQVALQQVTIGGQETVTVGNPVVVDISKAAGADYTIDMSSIKYNKPGTYSYAIYEVVPEKPQDRVPNISYDSSFGIFSVTVVDKGTGTLVVESVTVQQNTADISGNAQNGWNITKNFTNTYKASKVEFSVNKKVVAENNRNLEVKDHMGGIIFALYNKDNYNSSNTPIYTTLSDKDGKANFTFTVKQSDYTTVKYYYLREVMPHINSQVVGMTYDTAFKYVVAIEWANVGDDKPNVTYYHYDVNEANGLGSVISDITANKLTITNTYDNNVVSVSPIKLSGKKTLNNAPLRANDSFTFELYNTDETFSTGGLTPIRTATVTGSTANGAFSFDGITFDSVGTKYMVVSEKAKNVNGITFDKTSYHITVDVTKVTTAHNKTILKATLTHIHKVGHGDVNADELNFNNTYTIVGRQEVIVKGQKILLGRTLVEGEFTFGLYEEGKTTPLYTVSNDKDGYFTFPTILYEVNTSDVTSYNKIYTYTVKEIIPDGADKKGITYNFDGKTEYTLVVTIKDDGNGGIAKSVTLDGQTVSDINVSFKNSYAANDTSITLSGTKTFNKDSGEFNFDLYEAGKDFAITTPTAFKSAKATVQNGSGKYSITLNYTKADRGYHYYVLKEAVPTQTNGVRYDPCEYYITVNAVDNGHGEMEARVMSVISAHTTQAVSVDTLDFSNEYIAAPINVVIEGKKILEGRNLLDNEFKFLLYAADSTHTVDVNSILKEAKNTADGSFAFEAVTIEEVGNYHFIVLEDANTTSERVTNDTGVYCVEIEIKDDGKGNLYESSRVITKVGSKENPNSIVFTNVYTPLSEPDPDPEIDPKPESPKTGDTTNLGLWFALLFISGGAFVGTALNLKKTKCKKTK